MIINDNIKKTLFCYFSPSYQNYTPLDIGLYLTLIRNKGIRINLHTQRLGFKEKDFIRKISKHNADIIIFCLDNITWSGVYAYYAALDFSKELKKISPDTIIGFQSYKIFEEHIKEALQTIDFIIAMNPEYAVTQLDDILRGNYVNGVYTKDHQTHTQTTFDIKSLPSPYLEGIFDSFIKEKARKDIPMYILTSRGCIYGCYYCHRSVKFENIQYVPIKQVYDEIEYLHKRGIRRFFIIDDCFITSDERLEEFVNEFSKRIIRNLSIKDSHFFAMIRPDLIDENIIKKLDLLRIKEVQLGMQTINPRLQYLMKREMNLSLYGKIADMLHKYNITMQIDILIGLPEDTLDFFKKSLDTAIAMRPARIQVKQIYINKGTILEQEREKYGITIYKRRYFGAPFIKTAKGITEEYKKKAYIYLKEMMEKHKEIRWKWVTEYGTYHDTLKE
jgi:radical SAM superfamily enzyme YgiQ (UPF0313 family)